MIINHSNDIYIYIHSILIYLTLCSTLPGSRRSARLSRRTLSNSSSNEVSMSLDESEGSNNNSKVGSQKRGKTTRKKDEDINADQKEEENMEDKERGTTRKTIGYVVFLYI